VVIIHQVSRNSHSIAAIFVEGKSNCFTVILSEVEGSHNQKGITMNEKGIYYIYILTNWNNKVMYVGVTNNLTRRIYQHKIKLVDGFTKKYNVEKLVYYESNRQCASRNNQRKTI